MSLLHFLSMELLTKKDLPLTTQRTAHAHTQKHWEGMADTRLLTIDVPYAMAMALDLGMSPEQTVLRI